MNVGAKRLELTKHLDGWRRALGNAQIKLNRAELKIIEAQNYIDDYTARIDELNVQQTERKDNV